MTHPLAVQNVNEPQNELFFNTLRGLAFMRRSCFHESGFTKGETEIGMGLLPYCYPLFSVFNLRAESIPVQTLDNRFIWDNVHVVT